MAHRLTPHCDYGNYAGKEELRHALIADQRGLCCYCMDRIHNGPDTMKIEHWRCQAHYPAEQLIYRNLLGACVGGQGQPDYLQHCDTSKADRDLLWNPANPAHHIETRIGYELDGTICAVDAVFDVQLNNVLNLNLPLLKNARKGVLTGILDWWKAEKARIKGAVSRERFENERQRLVAGGGILQPYCQVAVRFIEQRLASMA